MPICFCCIDSLIAERHLISRQPAIPACWNDNRDKDRCKFKYGFLHLSALFSGFLCIWLVADWPGYSYLRTRSTTMDGLFANQYLHHFHGALFLYFIHAANYWSKKGGKKHPAIVSNGEKPNGTKIVTLHTDACKIITADPDVIHCAFCSNTFCQPQTEFYITCICVQFYVKGGQRIYDLLFQPICMLLLCGIHSGQRIYQVQYKIKILKYCAGNGRQLGCGPWQTRKIKIHFIFREMGI